ncbi:MAG TPA: argininosuccinate lyase, partial [Deinococcales bacterium]|nr:argininosuccinate lyase [Deinococcales bacterium]
RSRNDQVATDLRLFTREACTVLTEDLRDLRGVLLESASSALQAGTILPGYTHLQVAQPILLAHWFLAYERMLARDAARLRDARERLNESPLGAAALAGTSWPVDREFTARELGFDRPMANSLDAVASRDFALEFLSAVAIAMTTLSRLAEELVLYSSAEFGYLTLPDAFTTGSSIMPQKKNPDACELVRGKTGRVLGNLAGLLATVKGLPLAYNKDLQEDKEPVFDSFDTLHLAARTFAAMLEKAGWHADPMRRAAERGYSTATDLADTLARAGLPFRQAHEVVGSLVGQAARLGLPLDGLSTDTLRSAHPMLSDPKTLEAARAALSVKESVNARASLGGTAPARVTEALKAAREQLAAETVPENLDESLSLVSPLPGSLRP